ncbi:class I SAM-dependent methyltransferase [Isosphaeraceae bacterium EP7]
MQSQPESTLVVSPDDRLSSLDQSLSAQTPSTPQAAAPMGLLTRARLALKLAMWPGTNWVSRDKSKVIHHLLVGSDDQPVRTLDCGCGNAYFAYEAFKRGATCTGITIYDWERRKCEEMRDYLQVPEARMQFQVGRLDLFADDPSNHEKFDQVMMFDVIEHIMDARAALRQVHTLLDDDGFVYLTTPDRDWQGNASRGRVSRTEDGWHVRNGFTFEQLETVLEESGFEPIDRLRFGTNGSTLVTRLQHSVFRSWIDPLTVLFFPLLKLLSLVPGRDTHTIFVLARKRQI